MLLKCPACLAAYITLATGLGISFSTATCLRTLLLFLSVSSITLLLAKHLKRLTSTKCD
jgi:hypothetical protein